MAACMAERGFTYTPSRLPPSEAQPSRLSGLTVDVERARTEGYGFAALSAAQAEGATLTGDDPGSAVDSNGAYLSTLTDAEVAAWLEALNGAGETTIEQEGEGGEVIEVATDGCGSQVETAIYGDLSEWDSARNVFEDIERETFDRLDSDDRLVEARAAWIRCMSERGFAYSDPEEPQTEAYSGYLNGGDRELAQAREIEIATADAECVIDSGVASVFDELAGLYRLEAESSREADLVAVRAIEAAAVDRAKELVGGS